MARFDSRTIMDRVHPEIHIPYEEAKKSNLVIFDAEVVLDSEEIIIYPRISKSSSQYPTLLSIENGPEWELRPIYD